MINWFILSSMKYQNITLTCQMVCSTEPSEKLSSETVWGKRAGTFKNYLAGDWMNHLSVTVNHRLTLQCSWITRSHKNPNRTLIGLNHQWFGHKHRTWSLTRWILAWSRDVVILRIQLPHKVRCHSSMTPSFFIWWFVSKLNQQCQHLSGLCFESAVFSLVDLFAAVLSSYLDVIEIGLF